MQQRPVVQMELELVQHRGTLSGSVTRDGSPPRRFTGWMELNSAIETLQDAARPTPTSQESPVSTYIIVQEVEDVDRWLASTSRAQEFERIGATVREFVDPQGSQRVALVADVPDEEAFQQLLQSDGAAAAMREDGVREQGMFLLREADRDR